MKRSWLNGAVFGGATVGLVLLGLGAATTPPEPKTPVPWLVNPFVRELAARGITDHNTARILIVGSEGAGDGGVEVTLEKLMREVQEVWDTFYQSRPHKLWVASGNRTLKLYREGDLDTPVVEVLVNATDRSYIRGAFDDGFRCPGLNKMLGRLLKSQQEREQRQSKKDG